MSSVAADAARAARVNAAGGAGSANALEPVLKRPPGSAVKFNPLVTASNMSEAPLAENRYFGNEKQSFSNRKVYPRTGRGPHPELNENAKSEGLWGKMSQEETFIVKSSDKDYSEAAESRRAARVRLDPITKPTLANKNEAARLNAAAAAREVLASEKALRVARNNNPYKKIPDWKRKTRNNRKTRTTRTRRNNRNNRPRN